MKIKSAVKTNRTRKDNNRNSKLINGTNKATKRQKTREINQNKSQKLFKSQSHSFCSNERGDNRVI